MSRDRLRLAGTTGQLLVRSLERYRDREALVDGEERLTYAAFGERVGRMIAALQELGQTAGSSLALLSRNRADVITAYAAAFIAGIRITPMSPLGAEDDQAFILEDAEIDGLLVDDAVFAARGRALKARVRSLKHLLCLGPAEGAVDLIERIRSVRPAELHSHVQPDDVAVIGYTGGTTGRPKGVVHTQASLLAATLLMVAEWEWPAILRLLAASPVSHAAGLLCLPTFMRGGAFHLLPAFDAERLLAYVESERITATFLVPTMIYRLLDCPQVREHDLTSLQAVFYGAAPMSAPRLREALGVFGPVLIQIYGQGEMPNCIAFLGRAQHDLARPGRLSSCGLPLASIDLALLDELNRPVAPGEVGEICVRGAPVMREYWKRPQETQAAFAGGWLHTGDMGRLDADGYLYIVDRKKDMIISGGYNIFSREVEDVVGLHPDVAMCAVIGVPDEQWGEAVTAVIVPKAGSTIDPAEVIRLVRDRKGAAYAPKQVVVRDSLPLTPIGKPDKKVLRVQLAAAVASGG